MVRNLHLKLQQIIACATSLPPMALLVAKIPENWLLLVLLQHNNN